ncbi:MAG: TonB-dependent receptor [Phycisphaerae bacterium]|nr:TonB-dependent receptor [Gemmatimonadaceae bacterium]
MLACALVCAPIASPIAAQVAGEVRGRVLIATTLQAIPHALVELSGQASAVRVSSDGTYAIRGLAPAPYTLSVRALGYTTQSREVTITNGRVITVSFELVLQAAQLGNFEVSATRDRVTPGARKYSRLEIERSGLRDLAEILRVTPGVTVTQTGGSGQPSQVSIRGSGANQVLVLLDGVPQNSGLSGLADLSRIALENVEQIVVRTDAQSARYGPRAMAGAIDVISRKPLHELSTMLRTGAQHEYHASVAAGRKRTAGSANVGGTISADLRRLRGDFFYTVPEVRGGGRTRRMNAASTIAHVQSGLSVEGDQSGFALRGVWQQSQRGMAGTIVQPSSTGKQDNSRWSGGATGQGRLRNVGWSALADVTSERGVFADSDPPFGPAFDDTLRTTGSTGAFSLVYDRSTWSLQGGVEARGTDIRSTSLTAGAARWQRQLSAWTSNNVRRPIADGGIDLNAEFGARVDHNSLTADSELSPRVALQATNNTIAVSASIGSGYAPATIADQYFREGVQTRANPNLRPERTRRDLQGRLALHEQSLGGLRLSAEAAAYRADIDGMILWLPDFQYVWSPSNYNVQRRGWELSAASHWLSAQMELQAALSRSDVTYAGGVLTGQVAYRPRYNAHAAFSIRPSRVQMQFTGRYVGARRTIAGSSLNALAPYGMLDIHTTTSFARGGWTFSPAMTLENAMNRDASMLADYPLPPRTWSISLRVRQSASHQP